MKTRQEVLKTQKAYQTYRRFLAKTIPASICRGLTTSDSEFFYSELPLWSDTCEGWVSSGNKNGPACASCVAASESYYNNINYLGINDIRKQLRDSDSASGQASKPSKPRRPALQQVSTSKKHSRTGHKSSTAIKNKKNRKSPIQKGKKI
jgi:hypothetical protein